MDFEMSQITSRGHSLLAKVLAGETDLRISGAFAGDGIYDGDAWDMTDLVSRKLKGEIISVTSEPRNVNAKIVIRFSNITVDRFFELREIGIFCEDEGEDILYAYAAAGERANFIPEYNWKWAVENEITFYFYTASAANIVANIVRTEYASEIIYNPETSNLDSIDVQSAIDELAASIVLYPLAHMFLHGLNDYPVVRTLEVDQGYGQTGYGHGPYGGGNVKTLKNSIEYTDRNNLVISVGKKYNEVKSVTRINPKEYIVLFNDSTLSLFVVLVTDCVNSEAESDSSIATGVTTFNGRAGDVTLIDKDIPATIARKADIQSTVQEAVQAELYDVSIDAGEV